MNDAPSLNTQAILLLTAPLILGRERRPSPKPLAAGEYNRLARRLRELRRQPADLLGESARTLLEECRLDLDPERLDRLLDRGFLLSQAMERWRTRALWVTSRADAEYPRRLKKRLREQAPPVLYGCGNRTDLDTGGLAVVGSRNVDDNLIAYTEGVGRLAAGAQRTLVSGGARGIDQAAMRGALDAGGTVACVLADGLERAAMRREHRNALMDGRLVLSLPVRPCGWLPRRTRHAAQQAHLRAGRRGAGRQRGVREGRHLGRRGRATRPPSIRLGLRPRHRRDGEGPRRIVGARSAQMAQSGRSGDSRHALGHPARSNSRTGFRLPAPRGPKRAGSNGLRSARRGADADPSCRAWLRRRFGAGRQAACKGERTAPAVPGRAEKRSGRRRSA